MEARGRALEEARASFLDLAKPDAVVHDCARARLRDALAGSGPAGSGSLRGAKLDGVHTARGRQLRSALRSCAPTSEKWRLRARSPSPLVERIRDAHQLLPDPLAAALRSPRKPVARLPGAAPLPGRTGAPHRLFRHAAARLRPAAVVRGDESAAQSDAGLTPDLP